MQRWGVAMGLAVLAATCCASERIPVTFIVENYTWAVQGERGAQNRLSWIEGSAVLNDRVRVVGSFIDRPTGRAASRTLDETYVEVTSGPAVARIGRMRPRFGFGDWSELLYTPIVRIPMVRVMPLTFNLGLLRQDCGFDVATYCSAVSIQVGLFDAETDGWQYVPKRLDHATVRVQGSVGDLMVGLNATTKLSGNRDRDHVGGIDARWSSPHWQVRGEYVKGLGISPNAEGGYLDVFFRPERLHRTQVGARVETYTMFNGARASVATLGLRQILAKELTLSLNYGWGNDVGPASNARGWSAQLLTAFKF